MSKTFILDTNLLLLDSEAMFNFKEHNVVIPIGVIEEIDKFKKGNNELGRNARQASRHLDELSLNGDLSKGIKLKGGGKLFVYSADVNSLYKEQNVDLHIIQTAQKLAEKDKKREFIIVSRDTNVRLKARALGLLAEDYNSNKVDEIDKGYDDISVDEKMIASFELDNEFDCTDLKEFQGFNPNHYFCLKSNTSNISSLARLYHETINSETKLVLRKLNDLPLDLLLRPKNREQTFVIDALLDEDIKLVCISGKAGTGKTLMATLCGWKQVDKERRYDRLLVARPIVQMGNDIGFLPGSLTEKLDPWMTPIYDAFDVILGATGKKKNGSTNNGKNFVLASDKINIEPLTYIRGRSIHQQFVIIDECLSGNTFILTSVGKRKIKSIVDNFDKKYKNISVKSFNEETKLFEWKPIRNVWNRGFREVIKIRASNRLITCTTNHKFLTNNGWVEAGYLKNGDILITTVPESLQLCNILTTTQEQILLGSYMGDGSIQEIGNKRFRLKITHGFDQIHYNEFKAKFFNSKVYINKIAGYSSRATNSFVTETFVTNFSFGVPKVKCSQDVLDNLSDIGLAIWFMDDGGVHPKGLGARLHTSSFDEASHIRIMKCLKDKFDIDSKIANYRGYNVLNIGTESYKKLCKIIAKYVHEDLSYKIHFYKEEIGSYAWDFDARATYGGTVVDSIEVAEKTEVYDLEVEDNHNFIVCSSSKGSNRTNDGIVVHNCQNLSPLEVKTIVTRAGQGTKIVLTGDIEQIDNPYVDKYSNGLSITMDAFKTSKIAAHIMMSKGVRSELAEEATNRL